MRLKKLALGMLTIVLLSVVLGGAFHFRLVKRYLAGEFREGFLDSGRYPGITFVSRAEVEDLFQSGGAVLVDSRTAAEYAAGHIPGAVSAPLDSADRALAALTAGHPLGQPIVVYCEGGDCQTSAAAARLIHDRGFRDIRVYQGGWTDWLSAGLPAEAGE